MAAICYPDKNYCEYFKEVKTLEEFQDLSDNSPPPENESSSDKEQNSEFLEDLGVRLEDIALEDSDLGSSNTLNDLNCILTPKQRATVKRHIATVRATLRQRGRQRRDVRSCFPHQDGLVDLPDSSESDSSQKRRTGIVYVKPFFELDDSSATSVYIPTPDYDDVIVPPSDINSGQTDDRKAADDRKTADDSKPVLPEVIVSGGTTNIDDLGKKDQKILNTLACIELMILFEEYGITFRRRKLNRKVNDHGVFGVPLQTLLDKDRKKLPAISVPLVFQHLVQHLEEKGLAEEGLLRVPGRLSQIKELREECNNAYGRGKTISFDDVTIHEVAGLLKLFLRELPNPLLTSERVDAFIQIDKISDPQKRVKALNLLILVLPEAHRNVLQRLLAFLAKVVGEQGNRMTVQNVAMVIAPNLFLASTSGKVTQLNMDEELRLAGVTSNIVLLMIRHQDDLWKVPDDLMEQIREKHKDAVPSNPIMRLLGSKDKSDKLSRYKCISSNMEISIKIEPSGDNTRMALQSETTASDVIEFVVKSPGLMRRKAKGLSRNSSDPSLLDSCSLYEVGGNIGERRLNPDTKMISVCQVNPNAKYVIRTHPQ